MRMLDLHAIFVVLGMTEIISSLLLLDRTRF
jgi:hypothetical protein